MATVMRPVGMPLHKKKDDKTGEAVLVIGGASAALLYLLTRKSTPKPAPLPIAVACNQLDSRLVQGAPSGKIYAVDALGTLHWIDGPPSLAWCGYCTGPGKITVIPDSTIAGCLIGATITGAGTCVTGPPICPATPAPTPTPTPAPNTQQPCNHTVRGGETLISIARSAYGADTFPQGQVIWEWLYNVNQATIDATARAHGYTSNFWHWIFPGEMIHCPVGPPGYGPACSW